LKINYLSYYFSKLLQRVNEIGCMCYKCNCNKTSLLVTAVCDSCLNGNHTNSLKSNLRQLDTNKIWRVETLESIVVEPEE